MFQPSGSFVDFPIQIETNQDKLTGVMMTHEYDLKNKKKKDTTVPCVIRYLMHHQNLEFTQGPTQQRGLINVSIVIKVSPDHLISLNIKGSTQGKILTNVITVRNVLSARHLSLSIKGPTQEKSLTNVIHVKKILPKRPISSDIK